MKTHQTDPTRSTRSAPRRDRAPEIPAPAARTHRAVAGAHADLPVHDLSRMSIGPQSRTEPLGPDRKHAMAIANNTGLPGRLKAGIENLSGFAMDDVRVHFNSSKPAALHALAYTQGTDIHVGPGQERHLPHEAWHVVQQKQGRVKPTLQMKGIAINDDDALEREADATASGAVASPAFSLRASPMHSARPLQRMAATAQGLEMTGAAGTAALFNASRPATGDVFIKTVPVASNLAATVIKAYIDEIRPVGDFVEQARAAYAPAAAAPVPVGGYIDRVNANPGNNMPAVWPSPAFLAGLPNVLGLSQTGVDFVGAKSKDEASSWLTSAATQPEGNVKSDRFFFVDPFQTRHTFRSNLHPGRDWVFTTQFNDSATGYIIAIRNGEKNITGAITAPANYANLANNPALTSADYLYSSTHAQPDSSFKNTIASLGAHAQGNTRGKYDEGFDAITYIGAEGARFVPVGKLGLDAKPQTEFYIKPAQQGWAGAKSVTLIWLMQSWGTHFGRAYGVPTATMANVLAALPGNNITTAPPGLRYNLTTDKKEGG